MIDERPLVAARSVSRTFGRGNQSVVAVHDATLFAVSRRSNCARRTVGFRKSTLLHLLAESTIRRVGTIEWPRLTQHQRTRLERHRHRVPRTEPPPRTRCSRERRLPTPVGGDGRPCGDDRGACRVLACGCNSRISRHSSPNRCRAAKPNESAVARGLVSGPRLLPRRRTHRTVGPRRGPRRRRRPHHDRRCDRRRVARDDA